VRRVLFPEDDESVENVAPIRRSEVGSKKACRSGSELANLRAIEIAGVRLIVSERETFD
jgi:hypothetical protein